MDPRGLILALCILGGVSRLTFGSSGAAARSHFDPNAQKFHVINLANGVPGMSVTTGGSGGNSVAVAVPIGEVCVSRVALDNRAKEANFTAAGAGANFAATTSQTLLAADNLVVTTNVQTSGGTKENVVAIPMPNKMDPQLEVVVDGPLANAKKFDVYVTAPNQSIDAAKPNGVYTKFGDLLNVSFGSVLPYHTYRVRLTESGTKRVVADSGEMSGVGSGTYRVHGFVHEGSKETHRAFTEDVYQS